MIKPARTPIQQTAIRWCLDEKSWPHLTGTEQALANEVRALVAALRDLVNRCDGPEGVRADGSNIDTVYAHAVLGDFEPVEEYPEMSQARAALREAAE